MKLALVLIIYRTNSTYAKKTAQLCESTLLSENISSKCISSDVDLNSLKIDFKETTKRPDLIIVLGGDGTVLKSANELVDFNIPILSFNIGGNLGFLTQEKQFLFDKSFINLLHHDQFILDSRTMLKCNFFKASKIENKYKLIKYYALNDFYLKSAENDISPTNQIRVAIDNEVVNEFKGDGLIISSATGSTAYSMAAGGPIIHPSINAFIINPICPMSLSSRPLVIPDKSVVTIKTSKITKKPLQLWKDGTKCKILNEDEFCEIKRAEKPINMISFKKSISYYGKLVKKLEWRGNLT
tara:strand:+ start:496 stop:1389 length:894 start_codon:yes stop_codon:yes gene_type:complete